MAETFVPGTFLLTPSKEKIRGLEPGSQVVFIWLCDYADRNTGQCYPSMKTLANDTGMSRKNVQRKLSDLEDMGLIEKEHRINNNEYNSNLYSIFIFSGTKDTPRDNLSQGGGDNLSQPRDNLSQGGGDNLSQPRENLTHRTNPHNQPSSEVTHITDKEKYKKESTESPPSSLSKKQAIDELIDNFQPLNPNAYVLHEDKIEREAMKRMFKKHGYEKMLNTIQVLERLPDDKYAPLVTTPLELEKKMGKVLAYIRRYERERKKEQETPNVMKLSNPEE